MALVCGVANCVLLITAFLTGGVTLVAMPFVVLAAIAGKVTAAGAQLTDVIAPIKAERHKQNEALAYIEKEYNKVMEGMNNSLPVLDVQHAEADAPCTHQHSWFSKLWTAGALP
jgi:hypothetical protein